MIEDSRERRKEKVTEFLCDQCDYKSPSKTLLKRHVQTTHEAMKFNCDQCDYNTTTKHNLILHTKENHQNKISKGEQCDYKSPSKTLLNRHIETKHEVTKFHCDQCNYKATTKNNLNSHTEENHQNISTTKKIYTSKRIKCELCDRKLNKEETFIRHKNQDHKAESSKNFKEVQKSNVEKQKNFFEPNMTFRRKLRSDKTTGSALESIN